MAPVLLVLAVRRDGARAWGTEVRAWAWAYPAYLFVAAAPGPSILRYLLLAFPLLWPFPEVARGRPATRVQMGAVAVLAVSGLVLQWVWISAFVIISHTPHHGPFP